MFSTYPSALYRPVLTKFCCGTGIGAETAAMVAGSTFWVWPELDTTTVRALWKEIQYSFDVGLGWNRKSCEVLPSSQIHPQWPLPIQHVGYGSMYWHSAGRPSSAKNSFPHLPSSLVLCALTPASRLSHKINGAQRPFICYPCFLLKGVRQKVKQCSRARLGWNWAELKLLRWVTATTTTSTAWSPAYEQRLKTPSVHNAINLPELV